jgi:type I restriction enzyme M protein
MDYADYVEQLTYLLFLKMADEGAIQVPENCHWREMLLLSGEELTAYYNNALYTLKQADGILGQIFQEPISKIKNAANLKKIIEGIEEIGWTKLDKDVQGEAFEGLLERTANEGKKGAGQFFTPRPLIEAIVSVIKPDVLASKNFKVADVACGTSGFLTVAAQWFKDQRRKLTASQQAYVQRSAYYGQELVVRPYRLGLMNMFLHGIDANLTLGDSIYTSDIAVGAYDCIITNPPFGTRGSIGVPKQREFKVATSNIQINFVQHIYEVLKKQGRAAIVLPDSILTDAKARELWKYYMGEGLCNVHTVLKLPRGTFNPYATGVKACVVFLQKGKKTSDVWVYDARTDVEEIRKTSRPLEFQKHFADFVDAYGQDPNGLAERQGSERFKKYTLAEVKDRDYDISFVQMNAQAPLETPSFYVSKLISNFEQQLKGLYHLKNILDENS